MGILYGSTMEAICKYCNEWFIYEYKSGYRKVCDKCRHDKQYKGYGNATKRECW
jgi:hypothetical protein